MNELASSLALDTKINIQNIQMPQVDSSAASHLGQSTHKRGRSTVERHDSVNRDNNSHIYKAKGASPNLLTALNASEMHKTNPASLHGVAAQINRSRE